MKRGASNVRRSQVFSAVAGGFASRWLGLSSQQVGSKFFRGYTTLPTQATVVRYNSHGDPHKVLKVETESLPSLGNGDVLVKMLAAPINPADLNMVEGSYPIGPTVPAIGGNEGLGEVLAVGNGVKGLAVNDWVIPAKPGFGTWRTHAVASEQALLKVRKNIRAEFASTVTVNPCTAYRLLHDFVDLKEGDVIIQNGANSAVGQAVIQMAHHKKVKTINIIRDRPDFDDTVDRMKQYGGYIVIADSLLGTPDFKRLVSDLPPPKLALNCVGGPSATELARALGKDGVMVTYGGMSRKPVQIPTSLFIFKNIQLKGFWLSRWVEEHSKEEHLQMINTVWDLIHDKNLRVWIERHPFETSRDFFAALKRTTEHQRNRKVLLTMADIDVPVKVDTTHRPVAGKK